LQKRDTEDHIRTWVDADLLRTLWRASVAAWQ